MFTPSGVFRFSWSTKSSNFSQSFPNMPVTFFHKSSGGGSEVKMSKSNDTLCPICKAKAVPPLGYGFYRAVCSHHRYKQRVKTERRVAKPRIYTKTRYKLSSFPCKRCGWQEGPTDTHRIIPGRKGGKYNRENVVPLCPNCHRLVTLGLIEL